MSTQSQQTSLLEIEGLTSYYGKVEVVAEVSLATDAGETVALLGRNGAGKSALMRSIMGLHPPDPTAGTVRLRGEDILGLAPHQIAQRGIAFAPDDRKIFPHLTVEENLILAQRLTRGRKADSLDSVYEALPLVHELRARNGDGLSGGEQKLVAIARAAIQNPALLMLDETSEGLSPVMTRHLIEALKALQGRGITMLMADQNLRFCAKLAARGYLLERGRIQLAGDIDTLWNEMTSDAAKLMI